MHVLRKYGFIIELKMMDKLLKDEMCYSNSGHNVELKCLKAFKCTISTGSTGAAAGSKLYSCTYVMRTGNGR